MTSFAVHHSNNKKKDASDLESKYKKWTPSAAVFVHEDDYYYSNHHIAVGKQQQQLTKQHHEKGQPTVERRFPASLSTSTRRVLEGTPIARTTNRSAINRNKSEMDNTMFQKTDTNSGSIHGVSIGVSSSSSACPTNNKNTFHFHDTMTSSHIEINKNLEKMKKMLVNVRTSSSNGHFHVDGNASHPSEKQKYLLLQQQSTSRRQRILQETIENELVPTNISTASRSSSTSLAMCGFVDPSPVTETDPDNSVCYRSKTISNNSKVIVGASKDAVVSIRPIQSCAEYNVSNNRNDNDNNNTVNSYTNVIPTNYRKDAIGFVSPSRNVGGTSKEFAYRNKSPQLLSYAFVNDNDKLLLFDRPLGSNPTTATTATSDRYNHINVDHSQNDIRATSSRKPDFHFSEDMKQQPSSYYYSECSPTGSSSPGPSISSTTVELNSYHQHIGYDDPVVDPSLQVPSLLASNSRASFYSRLPTTNPQVVVGRIAVTSTDNVGVKIESNVGIQEDERSNRRLSATTKQLYRYEPKLVSRSIDDVSQRLQYSSHFGSPVSESSSTVYRSPVFNRTIQGSKNNTFIHQQQCHHHHPIDTSSYPHPIHFTKSLGSSRDFCHHPDGSSDNVYNPMEKLKEPTSIEKFIVTKTDTGPIPSSSLHLYDIRMKEHQQHQKQQHIHQKQPPMEDDLYLRLSYSQLQRAASPVSSSAYLDFGKMSVSSSTVLDSEVHQHQHPSALLYDEVHSSNREQRLVMPIQTLSTSYFSSPVLRRQTCENGANGDQSFRRKTNLTRPVVRQSSNEKKPERNLLIQEHHRFEQQLRQHNTPTETNQGQRKSTTGRSSQHQHQRQHQGQRTSSSNRHHYNHSTNSQFTALTMVNARPSHHHDQTNDATPTKDIVTNRKIKKESARWTNSDNIGFGKYTCLETLQRDFDDHTKNDTTSDSDDNDDDDDDEKTNSTYDQRVVEQLESFDTLLSSDNRGRHAKDHTVCGGGMDVLENCLVNPHGRNCGDGSNSMTHRSNSIIDSYGFYCFPADDHNNDGGTTVHRPTNSIPSTCQSKLNSYQDDVDNGDGETATTATLLHDDSYTDLKSNDHGEFDDEEDNNTISSSSRRRSGCTGGQGEFLHQIWNVFPGSVEDAKHSVKQLWNSFNIQGTDIHAVATRIEKAKRQMEEIRTQTIRFTSFSLFSDQTKEQS